MKWGETFVVCLLIIILTWAFVSTAYEDQLTEALVQTLYAGE